MQFPQKTFLAFVCLGLAACATSRNRVPEAPIKAPLPPPVAIGHVSLVNEVVGFVLVETPATPETGTELQTRNLAGEVTSLLKVSQEKRPPFVIADVMKGKPHVGEVVTK